jgi:hypothetical protein
MTAPTLAQALTRAKTAVECEHGSGHDFHIRRVIEPLLTDPIGRTAALAAFTDDPAVTTPAQGWSGIRGNETASVTLTHHPDPELAQRQWDLLREILTTFKARKNGGGYTAYANDKTMAAWQEHLGE